MKLTSPRNLWTPFHEYNQTDARMASSVSARRAKEAKDDREICYNANRANKDVKDEVKVNQIRRQYSVSPDELWVTANGETL